MPRGWIIGNPSASAAKISRVPSSRSAAMSFVDRRFRTRCGELDIVARDGGVLVFVEVKARSGSNFGTPFESVTWQKRQRLSQMAASYLCVKRLTAVACRFDVVSIIEQQGTHTIELVRGAFDMQSLQR